jgi:hypothetical protein
MLLACNMYLFIYIDFIVMSKKKKEKKKGAKRDKKDKKKKECCEKYLRGKRCGSCPFG